MSSNAAEQCEALHFWDTRRNVIRTRVGGAVIGEGVVFSHGYSMLEELTGHATFFQVLVLNVTGRLPEKRLADWLEATFTCMSWPDPRIWCNGVGSYGGALRTSPVAAITAGTLAADSRLYGPGSFPLVAETIGKGLRLRQQGAPTADIVARLNRRADSPSAAVPGYARPIAAGDERIPVMDQVARNLGFTAGPHLELAIDIHDYMMAEFEEGLNLAGYLVSFLMDQNMSAKEIYRLYSLCVNSGIHACYGEAFDNPPESFLPLMCDDIEYTGHPSRKTPNHQQDKENVYVQ
ncbi:MAG: hypothetical protein OEY97_03810 [Nitrospirota bacterium]|nr:hypothetical protein [Nitrospirota bacterium]